MATTTPLKVPKRSESSSGFHFFNLYQCCPRKFYLRYHLNIKPKFTTPALLFGSAFHEGKAIFYTTKSEAKALAMAEAVFKSGKKELEFQDDFKDQLWRLQNMLHFWIEQKGKQDLNRYKVLYVEKEINVPIAHTLYVMTQRHDAIVQDKMTKLVYIMETKTSSFSSRVTSDAVRLGDQATSYLLGAKKVLNLDVYGVVADVSFWSKQSKTVDGIKNVREDVVTRTPYAIENFEKGVAQILSEINQKSLAYKRGRDPWLLFPRNSHYCTAYSNPCEFNSICYENCEIMRSLPPKFKRGPKKRGMTDLINDSFAVD